MDKNLKELTIEITQKCPNTCLFCSSYSHRNAVHSLTLDDALRVGKQSIALGLKKISISGGEPLFHPDILKIANFYNDIGLHTSIYTTGISKRENNEYRPYLKWDSFNKSGTTLIFNVQSTERTVHDALTQHKGSFDKTINSLKASLRVTVHGPSVQWNRKRSFQGKGHATSQF